MRKILMPMLVSGLLVLAGCDASEIPGTPYNGPDYVYFHTEGSGDLSGNVSKTLMESTAEPIICTRTVYVVGKYVTDRDRTFKITAEMDPSMGDVYDINRLVDVTEDTFTIKAGETTTTVTFRLLNDAAYVENFKTKTIVTNIKIAPTDDFAVGFEKQTLIYNFWISGEYQ